MEKEFVPYELAVKLKELGFDYPCIATVNSIGSVHIKGTRRLPSGAMCTQEIDAPLWQQAFDWFRLNTSLFCTPIKYGGYYFEIDLINPSLMETENVCSTDIKETYEEARQACLEKLIQLI